MLSSKSVSFNFQHSYAREPTIHAWTLSQNLQIMILVARLVPRPEDMFHRQRLPVHRGSASHTVPLLGHGSVSENRPPGLPGRYVPCTDAFDLDDWRQGSLKHLVRFRARPFSSSDLSRSLVHSARCCEPCSTAINKLRRVYSCPVRIRATLGDDASRLKLLRT